MGRVSKKGLDKNLLKETGDQLAILISSLVDKNEVDLFLNEFLTKEEKIMLGKRLILYILLYKGLSDSQIHNILSVSYETTRWYRLMFENKSEIFKKYINKLIKREKSKEFWKKVEKFLEPFDLVLDAKRDMRARAKLASGDFWND